MFHWKIHYKWWFSIAMLNYQRVINQPHQIINSFFIIVPSPSVHHDDWHIPIVDTSLFLTHPFYGNNIYPYTSMRFWHAKHMFILFSVCTVNNHLNLCKHIYIYTHRYKNTHYIIHLHIYIYICMYIYFVCLSTSHRKQNTYIVHI